MEIIKETLIEQVEIPISNGNTILYKILNGIYYQTGIILKDGRREEQDNLPIEILDKIGREDRCRFWFGDTVTGRAYDEEDSVTGYKGRSTGKIKIPLLIENSRSLGGCELDMNIVRIDRIKDKKTLYQHENFHTSNFTQDGCKVYSDGEYHSKHDTPEKAKNYIDFMTGKRYRK